MEYEDMETLSNIVEAACATYKSESSENRDYVHYLAAGEAHVVKFGDPQVLMTELAVRECISTHAASNPHLTLGKPRLPRLLFKFQRESTMYLVMEHVPLAEDSSPSSGEVAAMLGWLGGVSLPQSFPVCRMGGGFIRHRFFSDYEASLAFSSVEALQRYLERAFKQLSFAGQRITKPINILPERLVLMHPGLNAPLRAGVDTSGAIVLLDLSDFNILPESFLWIKGNENSNSLARVKGELCMTADPRLGLDDDGFPKKRKAKRSARSHIPG